MTSLPRPTLPRLLASGLVGAALVLGSAPAGAASGDLPSGRRIVDHRVKPGETATGLAVRFHAWTAELIAHNNLGPDGRIRVGQRLEIPVVVAAVAHRGDRAARPEGRQADGRQAEREQRAHRPSPTGTRHRWASPDRGHPSRDTVRRTVAATAARHGVDPQLALAVSWQESGWQMDRRSSAGAIGAMQVLPSTAAWMSMYEGRRLHPRRLADNATTGVRLLRVLRSETTNRRRAVAAYYQGLGAVRSHGLYDETHAYVANVLALKRRLEAGLPLG
jgi:soluble lytic murein transglycosylase-like protein